MKRRARPLVSSGFSSSTTDSGYKISVAIPWPWARAQRENGSRFLEPRARDELARAKAIVDPRISPVIGCLPIGGDERRVDGFTEPAALKSVSIQSPAGGPSLDFLIANEGNPSGRGEWFGALLKDFL
ncbi:MAG: hypothetical protein R3B96_20470 [Pirellulaceae bacterium]